MENSNWRKTETATFKSLNDRSENYKKMSSPITGETSCPPLHSEMFLVKKFLQKQTIKSKLSFQKILIIKSCLALSFYSKVTMTGN